LTFPPSVNCASCLASVDLARRRGIVSVRRLAFASTLALLTACGGSVNENGLRDGGPPADARHAEPDASPDAVDAGSPTCRVGGGTVVTLASGMNQPWDLVVDGQYVYWTVNGDGLILKTPVGGGAISTLASEQYGPTQIVVDHTTAYWLTQDDVESVSLSGGATTPIATAPSMSYRSLTVMGGELYFAESATGQYPGSIVAHSADGTLTTLAANQTQPGDIVVDERRLYWNNETPSGLFTVQSVSPAGGSVITLLTSDTKSLVAALGGNLYLAGADGLFRQPLNGGASTKLTSGFPGQSVAIDSENLYWATYNTIMCVPLVGGRVITLVSGPGGINNSGAIAVDATSVYWTDQNGGYVAKAPLL
jgi:hypothetical protein